MTGITHSYRFCLQLSSAEIGRYYQGVARDICVRAESGEQLRFAARHLRPFLTTSGIRGRFILTTAANHQFKSLKKLG
ncbi:MAG: DUF2835 domain-containing protein [Geopsychrobacter sp.]|nr:DUF2835 domain-containing protein [Geopsychrobacter sp.]